MRSVPISPAAEPPAPPREPVAGVSVVVPVFNEAPNLERLHRELGAALERLGKPWEILYVDDGSTDGSTAALRALAAADPRTKLVVFRRNYGQTAAMKAGIDHAGMEAVVTIDGDLQNDPADIPPMISRLEEGFDLVAGWRRDRQDAYLSRRLPSRIANRLIGRVTGVPVRDLGCTLKAMRRGLISQVELYGDMHRFLPILLAERGARCTEIETHHRARVAGRTKYGIGRTGVVLLDLFTVKYLLDYSAHPMRLFGGLGLLGLALAAVSFVALVAMKLFGGVDLTGNPLLLLSAMAVLAGIQLISLGILGEILVRIYFSQSGHAPYAVRERVNLAAPAEADG